MADVTVLVSPTPLYPRPQSALGFSLNLARRSQPKLASPVMVTLETADPSTAPSSPVEVRTFDEALLLPPKRSFRGHRNQSSSSRSQSAPPEQVSFSEPVKAPTRHVFSTFPTTSTYTRELPRPAPPLFRPRTFWRKTKRSGVTGASYSPASHLVRRSTFIAAGLSLDAPAADLSALGVESRVSVLVLGPDHILQLYPSIGCGTLTHWNINYAYAYGRQDNGLTSSSYPASSTPLDSTPSDSPTDVVAPASTETGANIATIISITSLPPLNTTLPHDVTKLPYHQHLDVIFLAPLFAVLGILLGVGAVSLWWKLRLLGDAGSGVCGLGGRKTGNRRRISLEPGPAYTPAPPDEGDGGIDAEGSGPYSTRNRSTEEVTLFAAGTPSKTTIHGTRYLLPTHMRDQVTIGGTVTKPFCTPFLIGASQFNSAETAGSDHGDPFTETHSASPRVYDAERAEAGQSRRSMFQRILNRSTLADGRQYDAVRTHDFSPSNHPRLNSIPTLAININPLNTMNSMAPHGGRSSAVDVPLRLFEGGAGGEVQRPVRAWLETPEGAVQTPGGTRYGSGGSSKYKATGDQHTDYKPMSETPQTPVSKVSQFWTPRWKNKAVPPLSSQSPAKPSPSPPCIVLSPSQSPSPMPRCAVPTSTREVSSKERKQQDLLETRMEPKSKSLERNTSIPQIDSSVLPRSPPLLMSPPLEAALLFTSTSCGALSFATLANLSPKLGSCSPPMSKAKVFAGPYDGPSNSKSKTKADLGSPQVLNANQSARVTSPDISLFPLPSSSAKKLKKRKSQSRSRKGKRQETSRRTEASPMLPFPSYPDHLVNAGQKASVSATLTSSTSQPTISPTPTMLAILAATQSLERVNEILMRGYSERALGGGDIDGEERMLRGGAAVAGIEESSEHGRYM